MEIKSSMTGALPIELLHLEENRTTRKLIEATNVGGKDKDEDDKELDKTGWSETCVFTEPVDGMSHIPRSNFTLSQACITSYRILTVFLPKERQVGARCPDQLEKH